MRERHALLADWLGSATAPVEAGRLEVVRQGRRHFPSWCWRPYREGPRAGGKGEIKRRRLTLRSFASAATKQAAPAATKIQNTKPVYQKNASSIRASIDSGRCRRLQTIGKNEAGPKANVFTASHPAYSCSRLGLQPDLDQRVIGMLTVPKKYAAGLEMCCPGGACFELGL